MAMDKQMSMFDDGGLMDEGGTVDPVSGNDVPVGSTQEEVRDDIPAQLSEGEFVLPADVVRYFGLEFIMKMRDEAKAGLARMEAMGQMGNSEEATLDDDVPFSMDDLDMEDDGVLEYSQGGVVHAQAGTFVQPAMSGMMGTQQSQFTGFQPQTITPPPMTPLAPTMPVQGMGYVTPTQQAVPTSTTQVSGLNSGAGSAAGFDVGPPDEYKTYRNEAGTEIQVPFRNGKVHPTFTVPEGYKLATEQQQIETPETKTETTQVTQQNDDGDDGSQSDAIISGDKGQFSTTDMRGVGYDRGAMEKAAKEGSVEDRELLDALNEIGKAQFKVVGYVAGMAAGISPIGGAIGAVGRKLAIETGVGKFKETKGVDPRREFLTSQKVTMDAFLSGLGSAYGGTRDAFKKGEGTAGQRLHELAPEVKRSLAGELKATQTALNTALEGKTMNDLRAEINNPKEGLGKDIAELGLETTYTTGGGLTREQKREKTYGQLFAEARATKSARDKIASQYGFDAAGMSLSDARKRGEEAQERIDAAEARASAYGRQMGGSGGDDGSYQESYQAAKDAGADDYGASVAAGVESYGISGLAKGGLAKQMEKSGLTPKK